MTFMLVCSTISSMTRSYKWDGYFKRVVVALWKLLMIAATVIGFLGIAGILTARVLRPVFFVDEVVKRARSPDRSAVAEVKVTRGGFGTVWTTRVHLKATQGTWTIYETGGSDFVPPLRWTDRHTLLVGLPCERFGHLSNPDDWESLEPRPERIRVRFEYPANCF